MRRGHIIVAALLVLPATPILSGSPALAQTFAGEPCGFVELQGVEGPTSMQAADRSGRFQVGVKVTPGMPTTRMVVWRDGAPRLGPEIDASSDFYAVSTTGIAVGYTFDGSSRQAVVYAYGQLLTLPLPTGIEGATAAAVNAHGEVAGAAHADGQPGRAVAWKQDGEARILRTPQGFTSAAATHIDDHGTILGYAVTDDPPPTERSGLVIWAADGTPRVLPTTGPSGPQPTMIPVAIHDGVVYGMQDTELVRWDLDAQTTTVIDTGGTGAVLAVNAHGSMILSSGFGHDSTIFVRDGVARSLDDHGSWVRPLVLTDGDLVYGPSNKNASPAYMDCR